MDVWDANRTTAGICGGVPCPCVLSNCTTAVRVGGGSFVPTIKEAVIGTYIELPLDAAYVSQFVGSPSSKPLKLAVTMPILTVGSSTSSSASFRPITSTSAPFLVLSSSCA